MTWRLLLLFTTLFVAMIGFSVTLPALPFFVERLALGKAASDGLVAFHVGALTSAYALAQLVAAPVWGRWSDRHGRRPLILAGLSGFALAQVLFGLGTSLPVLYGARLAGGVFAAALLTGASVYVADTLPEALRAKGMAWKGTALSLGFVVGPVLSGFLSRRDWHVALTPGHLAFDGFSLPFFAAAALAAAVLPFVVAWLPESRERVGEAENRPATWTSYAVRLKDLLALTFFAEGALALFEAVFALYAIRVLRFGPVQIGYAFALCGLVMALAQGGIAGFLSGRVRVWRLIAGGFGLVGAGLVALLLVRSPAAVLFAVALFSLGIAVITPNLLSLIASRSGAHTGVGLGLQSTFGSLGQTAGPVFGGLLFAWQVALPFEATAAAALILALWLGMHSVLAAGERRPAGGPLDLALPTRNREEHPIGGSFANHQS